MFHDKATTYEQMEKKPKEKKFDQNSHDEIRRVIDDNDVENQEKQCSEE